jgi:hypothetical protein
MAAICLTAVFLLLVGVAVATFSGHVSDAGNPIDISPVGPNGLNWREYLSLLAPGFTPIAGLMLGVAGVILASGPETGERRSSRVVLSRICAALAAVVAAGAVAECFNYGTASVAGFGRVIRLDDLGQSAATAVLAAGVLWLLAPMPGATSFRQDDPPPPAGEPVNIDS